ELSPPFEHRPPLEVRRIGVDTVQERDGNDEDPIRLKRPPALSEPGFDLLDMLEHLGRLDHVHGSRAEGHGRDIENDIRTMIHHDVSKDPSPERRPGRPRERPARLAADIDHDAPVQTFMRLQQVVEPDPPVRSEQRPPPRPARSGLGEPYTPAPATLETAILL